MAILGHRIVNIYVWKVELYSENVTNQDSVYPNNSELTI